MNMRWFSRRRQRAVLTRWIDEMRFRQLKRRRWQNELFISLWLRFKLQWRSFISSTIDWQLSVWSLDCFWTLLERWCFSKMIKFSWTLVWDMYLKLCSAKILLLLIIHALANFLWRSLGLNFCWFLAHLSCQVLSALSRCSLFLVLAHNVLVAEWWRRTTRFRIKIGWHFETENNERSVLYLSVEINERETKMC